MATSIQCEGLITYNPDQTVSCSAWVEVPTEMGSILPAPGTQEFSELAGATVLLFTLAFIFNLAKKQFLNER